MTKICEPKNLESLNQNIQTLRQNYYNQYIAYNAKGVIAHIQDLDQVLALAQASGEKYTLYFVSRRIGAIVFIIMRDLQKSDAQP